MATFHENLVQSFTNFKNKYITPLATNKQNTTDNNLNTTSKTVVGAINEINTGKAAKDLGSPDSTQLIATLTSTNDEKNAVPVHWSPTNGLLFVWKDGVRYYLTSVSDIKDNLNTANELYPLSAKQGYIMSRDVPWYGTSSTAASTTAKTATTSDAKFSLVTGAKVSIKFTYDNTASAPTLNVDSTGAKSIKAYGTTAPTVWWQAGDVVTFTYDGTNWIMGATEGQISQINSDLAKKVNTSDVVNNLSSTETTKPLSANMGKTITGGFAWKLSSSNVAAGTWGWYSANAVEVMCRAKTSDGKYHSFIVPAPKEGDDPIDYTDGVVTIRSGVSGITVMSGATSFDVYVKGIYV